MQSLIRKFFESKAETGPALTERLTEHVMELIQSKEFVEKYQQAHPPHEGVEITLTINGVKNMSALTDAMTAALNNLQSKLGAAVPTQDQINAAIHAVVDPAVATLTQQVQTITSSENTDAQNITDLQTAITEFTTAFAPAATPTTSNAVSQAADQGATNAAAAAGVSSGTSTGSAA